MAIIFGWLVILFYVLGTPSFGAPIEASLRPVARPQSAVPDGFDAWRVGFRARAEAEGISAPVLDATLPGLRFLPDVIDKDRRQSEFTKTLWDYLRTAVSDARIRNGQAALRQHKADFDRIEARYGVPRQVVAAIWGLESAYGAVRGDVSTLSALASLAHDTRRSAFFEAQLLDALRIVQAKEVSARAMRGSWAGAMGHTQFMPSSYRALAVDGDGDGRRDIWSDDPVDALASTAHYLRENGWTPGQPWGVEVSLPEGFDYMQANRTITRLPSDWAAMGVRGLDGRAVADHGAAAVLLPAGGDGAAFLVFDNFAVLETYNTADSYVIAVGHLADRLAGGAPIRGGWPTADRALTYDERIELQTRLTAAGFDTMGIDAKMGPLTIDAVRRWQKARGMRPDGYAPPQMLQKLRQELDPPQ